MKASQIEKIDMTKDPICGMQVDDKTGLTLIHKGDTLLFCSSSCMEKFAKENKIAKECDKIIEKVATSKLSVNEAVCFALIARHYKRLVAHLSNIATSVVLPISDLDYFDERRK